MTKPVKFDLERDLLEIRGIRYAQHHRSPLLGICRSAQLINVVLGGNLHQDIRSLLRLTYNRPGLLPTKQVRLEKPSCLTDICGRGRLWVNKPSSPGHPGTGQWAEGVVGRDLDCIIQAVVTFDRQKIIGVQWHPEYLFSLPNQFALFKWLVGGRSC